MEAIPSSLLILLSFPLLANAYTWQFTSQPIQCRNLSLSIQGSGQPPYTLLLLYTGPIPLQKKTEFRQNQNIPFSGLAYHSCLIIRKIRHLSQWSAVLIYPASFFSRSIALIAPHCLQVSDKSGFGTGGTSDQVTVLPSSDSSCYNTSQSGEVAWYFYTVPLELPQCELTQLFWDPRTVNGYVPSFFLLIRCNITVPSITTCTAM